MERLRIPSDDLSVLQIAAPGPVGGAESVLVGLALGLWRRGVRVAVAAVVDGEPSRHPVIQELRDGGVPVHPICVPHRAYLQERQAIRRLLQRSRPDVVHTHGYRTDLLDSGIARGMGIPTVTTIHGSSKMNWKTAIYEAMQAHLLRRFDAVVAVSRPLVAELERAAIPASRIHLVPNAWDGRSRPLTRAEARKALGLPSDRFIVGWVGRLIPVKGCDVFLRAVSALHDPAVHASIIGDGPQRAALGALAAQLGLTDRVHFHGSRDGAGSLFRAFDVWVLSSRSEGTPMVLFEAMAASVPIVAADVGGVRDVVADAEAFLVPPNDPATLAARLHDIHSGQPSTEEMVRAAGRRLMERCGTDQWIERYLGVYRGLVRDGAGTGTTEGAPLPRDVRAVAAAATAVIRRDSTASQEYCA